MLARRVKILFGIILVLTAALMGVYYLQQQQTVEVNVSPQGVVWQKWGSRAVDAETVEALNFDQITSSPFDALATDTHRSVADRFRFTLSDSADFRLLQRVLNNFASNGHTSMRWRVGNDRELLYRFPPFEQDSRYDMEIPGGEDLAIVKRGNQTSCVLAITLTPS